jgi:uncharacterized protein
MNSQRLAPKIRYIVSQDDRVVVVWNGQAGRRDDLPDRNDYAWLYQLRNGNAVEADAILDLVPNNDIRSRIAAPEVGH